LGFASLKLQWDQPQSKLIL